MPWYSAGSVQVTNGSNAVTGTGTDFISNTRVGDGFAGPDGRLYQVTNVASATAISISPNYAGTTAGAQAYKIIPIQGYNAESARLMREIILNWGDQLANQQPWTYAPTSSQALDALGASASGKTVFTGTPAASRTALELVKTTSKTDSTAGRVTLAGDGGLLTSLGVAVTVSGQNANTWGTSGEYYFTSATNTPTGNGYLNHVNSNNTGFWKQTWTSYNGSDVFEWTRLSIGGTIGPWVQDWNSGILQNPMTLNTAQTVTGQKTWSGINYYRNLRVQQQPAPNSTSSITFTNTTTDSSGFLNQEQLTSVGALSSMGLNWNSSTHGIQRHRLGGSSSGDYNVSAWGLHGGETTNYFSVDARWASMAFGHPTGGFLNDFRSVNIEKLYVNGTKVDAPVSGTFTPVVQGTTTAGTCTYTTQVGRYTRFADRYEFTINLAWTGHTGTGSISIVGMPFSSTAFSAFAVRASNVVLGTAGRNVVAANSGASLTMRTYDSAGGGESTPALPASCGIMQICGTIFI